MGFPFFLVLEATGGADGGFMGKGAGGGGGAEALDGEGDIVENPGGIGGKPATLIITSSWLTFGSERSERLDIFFLRQTLNGTKFVPASRTGQRFTILNRLNPS